MKRYLAWCAVIAVGLGFTFTASAYGQSFCGGNTSCTLITAGKGFFGNEGDGFTCSIAVDGPKLVSLYDVITKIDPSLDSDKRTLGDFAQDAIQSFVDKNPDLRATSLSMDNLASQQVTFIAISFEKNKKYSIKAIEVESKEDSKVRIDVQRKLPSSRSAIQRKPMSIPEERYHVIALSNQKLKEVDATTWADVDLTIKVMNQKPLPCLAP